MIQQQVYIINTVLMVADALCIIVAAYAAHFVGIYFLAGFEPFRSYIFLMLILSVMFLNNYFMGRYNLYGDRPHPTTLTMVLAITKSVLVVFIVLTATIFFLGLNEINHSFIWLFALYALILILVVRLLVHFYATRVSGNGVNSRKILVVGDMERAKLVSRALDNQLSWGHTVVGHLNVGEGEEGASDFEVATLVKHLKAQPIDEVLFVLRRSSRLDMNACLDICRKMGVSAKILPSLWTPDGNVFSIDVCQTIPFLSLRVDNFDAQGLLFKRVLDLFGGAVGGVIFLLFFPFVGLAIKLDSSGPVLFSQLRKGRHGRTFKLYKFRTMYLNAEAMKQQLMERNEMQGHMFKLADDPRVTKVGRFLRRTSIDEIPQFINVIRGEMSLVGTRPPTLDEVDKYQPEHLKRIAAKPGITGMWQVSGRNRVNDFETVVKLDCQYLDHWSLWGDVRILFRTIWVVLQRKGAT
jgi:exopolysaccharide biosynthesis polyprenyl glycosylphosphotransferase